MRAGREICLPVRHGREKSIHHAEIQLRIAKRFTDLGPGPFHARDVAAGFVLHDAGLSVQESIIQSARSTTAEARGQGQHTQSSSPPPSTTSPPSDSPTTQNKPNSAQPYIPQEKDLYTSRPQVHSYTSLRAPQSHTYSNWQSPQSPHSRSGKPATDSSALPFYTSSR